MVREIFKRAAYSIALILTVLIIGTIGLHFMEGFSYLDSFYFMSLLATGEGPNMPLATVAGKLFVSFMAFISVGSVMVALVFIFGPFFNRVLKIEERKLEKEEGRIAKGIRKYEKKL